MRNVQRRRKGGRIPRALGLLTTSLFAAAGLSGDVRAQASTEDAVNDLGKIRMDSALLVYQESGGRVTTIEPMTSFALNFRNGDVLNFKVTVDALTGASPNGAVPWTAPQTFVTPTKTSVSTTSTNASGHSTVSVVNGLATRSYTAPANKLPLDYGFTDERLGLNLGYSFALPADWRVNVGGSYSSEQDYDSKSANLGVSKDLFNKNTTLSLSGSAELDDSQPYFGTPVAYSVMSAAMKGGNASKTVFDGVAGLTQVMNRHWLAQLNYSIGSANGYQTDPYRIISVVDPLSGAPVNNLYEKRPESRLRQSVYFGNKIAFGPTVTSISGRAYRDSGGIKSVTADLSERIPLASWVYIEPFGRFYRQEKANFFQNYLVSGQSLPSFASSDSRLGQFDASTFGFKTGFMVAGGELYLRADHYAQFGNGHPANAIGGLRNENLFAGIKASSAIIGYSFVFP